jgi:hypothetical protein
MAKAISDACQSISQMKLTAKDNFGTEQNTHYFYIESSNNQELKMNPYCHVPSYFSILSCA